MTTDREEFQRAAESLLTGPLRQAVGYVVQTPIPLYRGIVGYMVEAPLLWISHSRFPVLVVAYDRHRYDILTDIVKQVQMAGAIDFFALLVAVPTTGDSANEAEELRMAVSNSVYKHDFVVLDREHVASIIAQNSATRLVRIILEQGIELTALSPYRAREPVSANMFFGREREIKEITQGIARGNYALVGGRRIGKSSILLSLERLFNADPRYHADYLSSEHCWDRASFLEQLALRYGIDEARDVSRALRLLVADQQRSNPGKLTVFLIDEVDALLDADARDQPPLAMFRGFRALSQERLCGFVLSGSKTLHDHLHDGTSPFFNFCTDLRLGPLEEESVAEILVKPMRQLGIELLEEELIIDRLIDVTSCHPSLVQWICARLVSVADSGRRRLRPEDVQDVALSAEYRDYFLETAWGSSTPIEKVVSILPRNTDFSVEEVIEAAKGYGLTDLTAIGRALRTLVVYALIERHGEGYRFVLRHFPRIVRESGVIDSVLQGWRERQDMEA